MKNDFVNYNFFRRRELWQKYIVIQKRMVRKPYFCIFVFLMLYKKKTLENVDIFF